MIETKQFKDGKAEEFEVRKGYPKELCQFCHTAETKDGWIMHKGGCFLLRNSTSTGF